MMVDYSRNVLKETPVSVKYYCGKSHGGYSTTLRLCCVPLRAADAADGAAFASDADVAVAVVSLMLLLLLMLMLLLLLCR